MRTARTETVTSTITRHDRACDICGANVLTGRRTWDESDVRISASIGNAFPEADCRKHVAYDVCVPCWTSKVLPALEALIGKPPSELESEDH